MCLLIKKRIKPCFYLSLLKPSTWCCHVRSDACIARLRQHNLICSLAQLSTDQESVQTQVASWRLPATPILLSHISPVSPPE